MQNQRAEHKASLFFLNPGDSQIVLLQYRNENGFCMRCMESTVVSAFSVSGIDSHSELWFPLAGGACINILVLGIMARMGWLIILSYRSLGFNTSESIF